MEFAAQALIYASLGMLGVGALLALVRLALGPGSLNRAVALDVVSAALVGVLIILIAWWDRTDLMVLLIVFTLTSFFSTVTVARHVERHAQRVEAEHKAKDHSGNSSPNSSGKEGTGSGSN